MNLDERALELVRYAGCVRAERLHAPEHAEALAHAILRQHRPLVYDLARHWDQVANTGRDPVLVLGARVARDDFGEAGDEHSTALDPHYVETGRRRLAEIRDQLARRQETHK